LLACDGYNGTYTGSYNVHLQRLNNPGNATALSFGQTLAGSINMAGEMDAYTFAGQAGQSILISMSRTSGNLWPQIRLYDDDGNPVGSASGSSSADLVVTLSADGTYTILVDDGYNGTYTGGYNLHLEQTTRRGDKPW
ncbi:MAG: pre-peptidase C-terminal domain-containing protein, partial [Anaerolineae bacterium]|nr:pre-peptidase C-terminal domain-containing protein [Anaerolineae bacterium]